MDAAPGNQLLLAVPDNPGVVGLQGLQGALWELDTASGKDRRIGYLTGEDAAWSPDRTQLAFVHGDELWVASRDGSAPRRLAALPGAIVNIRWSPDSRLLRFAIHAESEYRYPLWEVDAASGRSLPLLPEWSDVSEQSGAWIPNGAFVFAAEHPSGSDLWQILPKAWPATGHRLEQLTHGALDFSRPINIPGRRELAAIGARKQGELEHYDSRAGRFVPFLNGISAEMVDFSRDGKWAAWVAYPERTLWRSRADGSEPLQLTQAPLRAGMPRISPDGRRIAFTGDYAGKEMRTWLVPFNGGAPQPATLPAPGTSEVAPTWSPDSRRLLFRLDRGIQNNVLQILDLSSGQVETVPDSYQKSNQRWSPDGKWLAATPNDQNGLAVFNLRSRQWTLLSTMQADYPAWSRNSDFVYFCTRFESGAEVIYRVSVASRKGEPVADLAGTTRVIDETYGSWAGLGPDDSPLVTRSADQKQIYLLSFGK
jgi:Tol biopolymer transport system component